MYTNSSNYPIGIEQTRIALLSKIYIWSVVIEPLLFFNSGHYFAIAFTLSRFLQFIVLISLVLRSVNKNYGFKIINPFSPEYKFYSYFFILACLSGLYGISSGAYVIPTLSIGESINISVLRPFFEYFIAIYYFTYFVVLFKYFIKDYVGINYFFKIFTIVFYFTLLTGLLDYFLILTISGYEGLPRNLEDFRGPGLRFHGIIGEPRDAFVYLIFGLGVLTVKDIWFSKKKLSFSKIIIILTALMLTESASGIIGLLFSSILLIIFFIPMLHLKKMIQVIMIIVFLLIFSFYAATKSKRVFEYYSGFENLYSTLESGAELEHPLRVAANNIFPLWHRWTEVLELNITPLILGTGLGSSSVINNVYFGLIDREFNVINNPNANVIRIIFETGIICTLIYIAAFILPIKHKRLFLPRKIFFKIIVFMFIILGSSFAHRTVTPFLFLGVILVVFKHKYVNLNDYNLRNNSLAYPSKAEESAS